MLRRRWLLGILAAAFALAPPFATAGAPQAQKVAITGTEFRFTPNRITLRRGVRTQLTVRNAGKIPHEFMLYTPPMAGMQMRENMEAYAQENTYFQGIGPVAVTFTGRGSVEMMTLIRVELKPGQSAVIEFTPRKAGTFEVGCHIQGHYEAEMKGSLVVR